MQRKCEICGRVQDMGEYCGPLCPRCGYAAWTNFSEERSNCTVEVSGNAGPVKAVPDYAPGSIE